MIQKILSLQKFDVYQNIKVTDDLKEEANVYSQALDELTDKWDIILRFKYGILNARHFGDLPKYRGNVYPNWAILNNEKNIYLTIHKMMILIGDIKQVYLYK